MKKKLILSGIFVGKGSNEKEHNEVIEMLQSFIPNVELVGHQSNPFPYVKNADYLVLMSDRETSGLVITEAKIIGTPCIVSNFEAAYEQITDGENGFIYESGNLEDLFSKVSSLIVQPDMRRTMGVQACHTISDEWNASVAAKRVIKLFNALLQNGPLPFSEGICSVAK